MTTIFLVVMVFVFTLPVFFYTKPARAQIVPNPASLIPKITLGGLAGGGLTTTVADIPRKISDAINTALRKTAALAYKNTLKAFLNKMAYDAAVYIASGGKGQKPLFLTNPGKMLEQSADAAYGDFLDSLAKDVWGKSLCKPLTPAIQVKLDVWARQVNAPPSTSQLQAACPISQMGSNLFGANSSTHDKLVEFSKNFNEGASEFSALLKIESGAVTAAAQVKEMTWFTKILQGEFNPVTTTVTGETKTPAAIIQEVPKITLQQSFEVYQQYTGEAIADAVGIFSSTLTSRLLTKIFIQGFNPSAGGGAGGVAGAASQGIAAAKIQFASLNQPDYNVSGSIDIIDQLVSCPPSPAYNNCIIDEKFKIAIEQKLTVKEALDQGLLAGNKVFGFDAQGKEPSVQNGYPYRSLVILRTYRIIPDGWELAAQYIKNYAPGNYTLSQIVALYGDKTSPFYHLIDPNWVLKAPEVYCARQGAGEQIISDNWVPTYNLDQPAASQISTEQVQRQDYCADQQTCLFENDDGSCKKFGYCLQEKSVWKFQGDGCQAEYNSCEAFQKSDGTTVGYLKNTLDYNNCNSQSVGCQTYCTEQTNNNWNCSTGANTISLNAKAQQCSASAAGCSEFISTKPGSGTNIIPNSSFETYTGTMDDGNADVVAGWGNYEITGQAFQGQAAVELYNNTGHQAQLISNPNIDTGYPIANRTFNFSFYGKKIAGSCDNNSFIISGEGFGSDLSQTFSYYDAWTRYAGSVTFPADRDTNKIKIIIGNASGCQAAVDGLQLEENTATSDYKDYGAANAVYLNGTRSSCTQDQVGCEKYTNLTTGDFVPGIITNPATCNPNDPSSCDQCPAEFQGCKAFKEMPITQVPQRAGQDLISFMPDTGKTCPASAVGCEEYTNLDVVAKGGEGKEYYSSIRQCVEANDKDKAAYYTWVGSSEFGYQLQKFILKRSNVDLGPCTNMNPEGAGWPNCNDGAGQAICGTDTCSANRCTNSGAACSSNQDCVDYELNHNPDCAQFYDTTGTIYYRLRSRVIYVSNDCHPYRNSIDGQDVCTNGACEASGLTCSTNADCQKFIYHMIPGQGLSCQAEYAGCRAYKGNAGNNVRNVISSDFEQGTLIPWTSDAPDSMNPSTESIQASGHSMLVYKAASTDVGTLISSGKSYIISFWAKADQNDTIVRAGFTSPNVNFPGQAALKAGNWNSYKLGPLYLDQPPASGDTLTIFSDNAFYIDNIVIQEVIDNVYYVKGSYRECAGWENCDAYSDSQGNTHYLKSFSQLCPVDKVGCEVMIDTHNSSSPYSAKYKVNPDPGDLNRDSKVDYQDVVFIENYLHHHGPPSYPRSLMDVSGNGKVDQADEVALINYLFRGGAAPGEYADEYLTVPADNYVFLVNDPTKYCQATEKGCMKLGAVTLDANNTPSYQATYYLNNPDNYGDTLCNAAENQCSEYTSGSASIYFKDPGTKTCEYRKVVGQQQAGWYIVGSTRTSPDCPIVTGFCLGGATAGKTCNSNDDCSPPGTCIKSADVPAQPTDGYVGICPAESSGCQEYRDPSQAGIEGATNQQCKATLKAGTYETVCTAGPNINTTGCDPTNSATVCGLAKACVGGSRNNLSCNVSSDCTGGGQCVNTCIINQSSCRSYYYLSQSLDTASCTGVVDQREGCRLFYDSTAGGPVYDSDKTYQLVDTTKQAQSPQMCANSAQPTPDCDSNLILKVRNDRECSQWLDCTASVRMKNTQGQIEDFCYEVSACNKLDSEGNCVGNSVCSAGDREGQSCQTNTDCPGSGSPAPACVSLDSQLTNLTYSSPDDVDKVANLSGLSQAGINWGCSNNPKIKCTKADEAAQCGATNTCEVIEGNFPISAMSQLSQGVTSQDLITSGDMGDSDLNSSYHAVNVGWTGAGSPGAKAATVSVTQEDANGNLHDWTYRLDVNNILMVQPNSSDKTPTNQGASYSLSGNKSITDSQYVVSFKARYATAPSDNDKINVQIADTIGKNSFGQSFGEVQPTTTWQKYVLGPLKLSASGATNFRLQFLQSGTPTGLTFYLDDVSMKPVLETNVEPHCQGGADNGKYCDPIDNKCAAPGVCYQDTKVSRSCRMYPRSDSLYCTYTDTNGATYNGWYGYCLEADPDDPKQCLSWWPVDIIAGESNVLGAGQASGYSGRTPLFMCLEAKGNYNTANKFTSDYVLGSRLDLCGSDCSASPLLNQSYLYRRPIVTFMNMFGLSDLDNNCNSDNSCGALNADPNCGSNAHGICYCDNAKVGDITKTADTADQYDQSEIERIDWIVQLRSHNDWPACGQVYTTDNSDDWTAQFGWTSDGSKITDNSFYIKVNFDSNNKLSSFHAKMYDGSPGAGGMWVAGIVYLRETCQEVAKVVGSNGENTAWSNRVQSGTPYPTGYGSYPANYPFSADLSPFGGAVVSSDTPEEWDTRPSEPGNQPLYVEVMDNINYDSTNGQLRAGEPYSCSSAGGCGGTMCEGGTANGSDCNNAANIKTCQDGLGVCVGVNKPIWEWNGTAWIKDTQLLPNSITSNPTDAVNSLESIFAYVYEVWDWNSSQNQYVSTSSSAPGYAPFTKWQGDFNDMSLCSGARPTTHIQDYCGIKPTVSNIKVIVAGRIYTGGDVKVKANQTIQLTFNSSVDREQLPLQAIKVDKIGTALNWDSPPLAIDDLSKQAPKSDQSDPHWYSISYTTGDCPATGCHPRIQVMDNWDWCNSSVPCGGEKQGLADCRDTTTPCHTYDQFQGNIIIVP